MVSLAGFAITSRGNRIRLDSVVSYGEVTGYMREHEGASEDDACFLHVNDGSGGLYFVAESIKEVDQWFRAR